MRWTRWIATTGLAALLALTGGAACPERPCIPPTQAASLPGFLYGFSQVPGDVVPLSQGIGANAVRPTLSWRAVEATVTVEGLTLDDVRSAQAVSAWAAARDWSGHDARVQQYLDAGLYPIPIVGHGYSSTLPRLDGAPAAPDALGRAEYLARQYRTTRAMVERYDADGVDDAPGSPRVSLWQIENELNQAMLTAVFGWREPTFFFAFNSAWADPEFVTELLYTLYRAVKEADPTALTMTNFHSDVPPAITDYLLQPSWTEWLETWHPMLDVVGLDAYPNYYLSAPLRADQLGPRVEQLAELACGRPVMVVETGYPTGPAERGYDEPKQVAFLQQAFDGAVAAGAVGFLWFGAHTAESHDVVITQEDIENITTFGELFEQGEAEALIQYVLANPAYVQDHLSDVIQSVEPYWGAVRADGTPKPVWDALVAIGEDLPTPAPPSP